MRHPLAVLGLFFSARGRAEERRHLVAEEIHTLLSRLEASNCNFNRNGASYSATDAKRHLESKFRTLRKFQSAEQFVNRVASVSSVTGEAYLVNWDSAPIQSRDWLLMQLQEIRAERSTGNEANRPSPRPGSIPLI